MIKETVGEPKAPEEILHPGSRELFRYWESLRGERAAPERCELDLFAIRTHLPSLFIMERDSNRQAYKWRLAGTRICNLWREELTGKDVFGQWQAYERDLALRLLDGVVGSMQPCVMRYRLQTTFNTSIPVEMLCMPMRSYDGSAIHVLGSIMAFSDTHVSGHERIARIELLSARAIWTEPLPGDPLAARPGPSLARPFANFRVIEGGKSAGSPDTKA
jgi:hypothetical protein